MRTAGQYRLQQALSSCEVGDVWSGTDGRGRSVTVAVLNERASVDDRWRGAFAAAAATLAQASADQLPIVGADHDSPRPWVACASERGAGAAQIFEALGQRLRTASSPPSAAHHDLHAEEPTIRTPPAPREGVAQPALDVGGDAGDGRNPWESSPAQPAPGHPFRPYPSPADVYPNSPVSGYSISGSPISGGDGYPPYRSRVFGDQPPAKPKRNRLMITIVAAAGLLVGAGGAVAVMALGGDGRTPAPTTTDATTTDAQLLLTAMPPAAPGVEPPIGGGWPSGWPVFTAAESTKPMNRLDGVGFDFRVPPTWACSKAEQSSAAVRYRCGSGTAALTSGGDLILRACQKTCTEDRRATLRQREEAWGLRWTRSGPFTTWAETTQINGKRVYGLVYVAFWRSIPEGEIDRELVLRMTAPLATSDDLKKVANSIRDKTFTL